MQTRREFGKATLWGAAASWSLCASGSPANTPKPNIIFILADDVGYGDLGCYGATHVKTPNLDRLAVEGTRFTDAHATASVCSPTRYSLLTGQYAFRNPLGASILSGVAPAAIAPGQPTVASVLRDAGYATGLVGKWHVGLGSEKDPVDYNKEISGGPCSVGFDEAFFYPATNDRVPCVYIDGKHVVGLDPADPIAVSFGDKVGNDPTGAEHPEALKMKSDVSHSKTIVNGISRIGYMSGGQKARWVDEDMADTFTGKATAFIEKHREHPFFLYFAPHCIHEPMAPHPRFKGTSDCGTRGDAIHELDWCVGEVLKTLDRLGLAENTLIVFSSDNGGAIKDTYDDGTNALHARQAPNGPLRGEKGWLYEGGNRVPFLARWPKHVPAGAQSDALVGLVDLLATFSAAAGHKPGSNAGPDSENVLPALLGKPGKRAPLVLQGNGVAPLALREGPWKLITKGKDCAPAELYRLDTDLAEKENLLAREPRQAERMAKMLWHLRRESV